MVSSNNTLANNTASNNSVHGIYLMVSSNNLIYNNYFNNTNNAYDDGNNQWNISKTGGTNIIGGPYLGGNYWSDYAGADNDNDGLGDIPLPYNSSGDIQNGGDLHPLITGLSCDCGDICVNETGWWRDGCGFVANTMPIQAAVDNAGSDETICVKAGSYTENVDIAKRITLAGEGAGVVTVTAANPGDHVFYVAADYVNISGFNATGATTYPGAGIYLSGADHCDISDNDCSYNGYGIWLYSSSSNTLANNTANSNNECGISLGLSSNYNTLANNTASNNIYGIILYSSSNNTLTRNTANSNNYRGIYLDESSNNTLTRNTATRCQEIGTISVCPAPVSLNTPRT